MRIGLITRDVRQSSRPQADRLLLQHICRYLADQGHRADFLSLGALGRELNEQGRQYELLISASRDQVVLNILEAWAYQDVTVVNDPASVRGVLNRPLLFTRLQRAGIPVPPTGWTCLLEASPGAVVKAAWTSSSMLPEETSNATPWRLVQAYYEFTAETKAYGVGDRLYLPSHVCLPPAEWAAATDIVAACHAVTGLDVFGIDILWRDHQPVVVDVNDLPSFRHVHDAHKVIARLALARTAASRSHAAS